ncbi:MAG: hypothetical protein H6622_02230 [Halobacteriovoraceae bacterium]|nr:hypothetical protein [Halobacteriovoraceae bacterium]
MFSLIKFSAYFFVSFLILSYPVGNKTVFNYMYQVSEPYLGDVYESTSRLFSGIIKSGVEFTKLIFENSDPKTSNIDDLQLDKVKNTMGSLLKDDREDSYTEEEKEMLESILKKEKEGQE